MAIDPISKKLGAHYSKKFRTHGPSAEGVDWGSDAARVALRYGKMLDVVRGEPDDGWSLLDVGCGYGGLLSHTRNLGLEFQYHGIDLATGMIDWAKRNLEGATFECGDILDGKSEGRFDYVVCNGILTQKLDTPGLEMDAFCHRLVRRMFALCRKGVAFNVMTTKVNFFAPNLYYRNPMELLGWCMSELTPHVRLDHAYPLFEYTIYLYRVPR